MFSVLQKKQQSNADVYEENKENAGTEEKNYQRMTVKLICITLKSGPAQVNSGITGGMTYEKQQQQ
jgi:hypothetical protein